MCLNSARFESVSNGSNIKTQGCGNLILWLFLLREKACTSLSETKILCKCAFKTKTCTDSGPTALLAFFCKIFVAEGGAKSMTGILCSLAAVGGPPTPTLFSAPCGFCQQESCGCVFQACLAKGV